MKDVSLETPRTLTNGRTALHLEQLQGGAGTPLLVLHDLFGSLADWKQHPIDWGGPVWALDFAGHGQSTWRSGGAYYPELFVTDADTALAEIGPSYLAGVGLGAYVALLLAGSRPEKIPSCLLLPGSGMDGGGKEPAHVPQPGYLEELAQAHRGATTPETSETDPRVILARNDIRPVDYAKSFGARSKRLLLSSDGQPRPAWWEALLDLPSVSEVSEDPAIAFAVLGESG